MAQHDDPELWHAIHRLSSLIEGMQGGGVEVDGGVEGTVAFDGLTDMFSRKGVINPREPDSQHRKDLKEAEAHAATMSAVKLKEYASDHTQSMETVWSIKTTNAPKIEAKEGILKEFEAHVHTLYNEMTQVEKDYILHIGQLYADHLHSGGKRTKTGILDRFRK